MPWAFPSRLPLKVFKIYQLGEVRGPTFSLTHRSLSGSNTICNNLNPSLADIVNLVHYISSSPHDF